MVTQAPHPPQSIRTFNVGTPGQGWACSSVTERMFDMSQTPSLIPALRRGGGKKPGHPRAAVSPTLSAFVLKLCQLLIIRTLHQSINSTAMSIHSAGLSGGLEGRTDKQLGAATWGPGIYFLNYPQRVSGWYFGVGDRKLKQVHSSLS